MDASSDRRMHPTPVTDVRNIHWATHLCPLWTASVGALPCFWTCRSPIHCQSGLVRDGPSYVCAPISFRSLRSSVSFLRDSAYMLLRSRHYSLRFITRISVIIADTVALVVAWRKSIGALRGTSFSGARTPLSEALICNGMVLFFGLLLLNIYELLATTIPSLARFAGMNPFVIPLTTILMCRWTLSIRQAGDTSSRRYDNQQQTQNTIRFNSLGVAAARHAHAPGL
ncbi:hypothetical protein BC629DRAFT_1104622 [Irpex lacteus]|nr:hypothetical protein BC629DRAFT_1104622 [Irpex lacteus]